MLLFHDQYFPNRSVICPFVTLYFSCSFHAVLCRAGGCPLHCLFPRLPCQLVSTGGRHRETGEGRGEKLGVSPSPLLLVAPLKGAAVFLFQLLVGGCPSSRPLVTSPETREDHLWLSHCLWLYRIRGSQGNKLSQVYFLDWILADTSCQCLNSYSFRKQNQMLFCSSKV